MLTLPWVPIAVALYYIVRAPAPDEVVRFALYRPSDAMFFLDRGASPGESVDYPRGAIETVAFGAKGDVGLACSQRLRENGRGFRTFVEGRWFMSGVQARPATGDLALGQPGDLPYCADFDGDGIADSGVFRDGQWSIATGRTGEGAAIRFVFGSANDLPVVLNVEGAGNATDRKGVVYGVYRRGKWILDTNGSGAVGATHSFGGLPQDLPLLIPRWSRNPTPGPQYSLAIFRDGTWYIKPDPEGMETITFRFGQAGDLPGFVRQRRHEQARGGH